MSDTSSFPPVGGLPARRGRVSAPIGALRRAGTTPVIVELEDTVRDLAPAPAPTPDHLIRARRRAPSDNRIQVVIALVMLLMGVVTALLLEPQWRSGKSILPAAVVQMVKAIPGVGPWFASNLRTEMAAEDANAAGPLPPGEQPTTEEFLPNLLLELTPDMARRMNEAVPVSNRGPAAAAFSLPHTDLELRRRAVQCLTAAVYYEAGNESPQGQAAVAQVILNRMRHPAYPKSVCGVVFQGSERSTGCQFTFTCDGSLRRVPDPARWRRAQGVAEAALNGAVEPTVGLATHYHADYVVPKWASKLVKAKVIGAHIFYRWSGGWGSPGAFTGVYAGAEQQVSGVWPIDAPDLDTLLAEVPPPLPPSPAVALASLEPAIPVPAPEPVATAAPAPAPQAGPQTPAPAPAAVTPAPPKVSPPAPKNRARDPGSRPRLPVPSHW